MISDRLIPALQEAFPGLPFKLGKSPTPIATFAAKHPDVGEVRIFDDGDEATILITEITHGHFNPYDESLSDQQVAERVTEEVVDFLKALFSDHVLLYHSTNPRVAGWRILQGSDTEERCTDRQYFLWSGPII